MKNQLKTKECIVSLAAHPWIVVSLGLGALLDYCERREHLGLLPCPFGRFAFIHKDPLKTENK